MRIPLIDVIRFGSAIAVLLYHYCFRYWNRDGSGAMPYGMFAEVVKYGYLGVDAFFMVSGFVILMTATDKSAVQFSISRIVRLYPAYWFACCALFVFALQWPVANYLPGYRDFFANLTMFHGYFGIPHVSGVFWTLVVEMQFYLLMLVLILAGLLRWIKGVLLVWMLTAVVADYLPVSDLFKQLFILSWCQYFVAGSVFYLVRKEGLCLVKGLILGLSLFYALKHGYWYLLLKENLSGVVFDPLIMAIVILTLYAMFLAIALNRLPGNYRFLSRLGVLTYPLYLIHSTLGEALMREYINVIDPYLLLVGLTLAMILLAYLIHRWVEKPLAGWLKRNLNRLHRRYRTQVTSA
ncbi:MAG: peptidoglycan/LPS O-acetylase OafA/YrhL [Motiliproteus sp.]